MQLLRLGAFAGIPLLLIAGPAPAHPISGSHPAPMRVARPAAAPQISRHTVGLGNVLNTKDGGQVFGFDINQNGDDGVLASAQTISSGGEVLVSMETFDQNTGKIVKSFAQYMGKRNEYAVDGIVNGDVALVTHYVTPPSTIFATRHYEVMSPVTSNKFTGKWTPPIKDIDVLQVAQNQTTPVSLLFAIELKNQDNPDLVVTNVKANKVMHTYHLDPNLFGLADGPVLGQFTAANEAVFALSPDAGKVGGAPPINVIVNLKTGKTKQFNGFNNGTFHAGSINGMAIDPNTGIAATTTELNAQVEFYDIGQMKNLIAVQLPCTGPASQLNSGASVTVDAVNKLFLVTEPFFCSGSQNGAVIVYDEAGNFIESIPGFHFAINEPPVALNPSKRMGWAFGPQFSQLQQFFY